VPHPKPIRDSFILCYVTDKSALSASPAGSRAFLLEKVKAAAAAGVDWIQIREKQLSGRELAELANQALQVAPAPCRVLINDRLDVACAVGAAGVHLTEQSISVADARTFARERGLPASFLVGRSAHSFDSAWAAADSGANYIIFGPVFSTPSKAAYGPPQGIERLATICRRAAIPVLAIGGITPENAGECIAAGVAGIAAIRIFQDASDLPAVVDQLRQL
jgi:thiamine-phosphate pyrophosphorylase